MLLGGGGLETGALGDPGPGVVELPGVQGFATVADVPAGCEVPAVVEVEPMPLLVEELVLVGGVPVVVLLLVEAPGVLVVVAPGVPVEVLEPMLPLALAEGVHGAVVALVPDWPCTVP